MSRTGSTVLEWLRSRGAEVTVAEDNAQPESRKFAETMGASFVAAPSADELSAERTDDGRADNAGADHRHGILRLYTSRVGELTTH